MTLVCLPFSSILLLSAFPISPFNFKSLLGILLKSFWSLSSQNSIVMWAGAAIVFKHAVLAKILSSVCRDRTECLRTELCNAVITHSQSGCAEIIAHRLNIYPGESEGEASQEEPREESFQGIKINIWADNTPTAAPDGKETHHEIK